MHFLQGLGGYEDHRRQLEHQRRSDYQQHLDQEKSKREQLSASRERRHSSADQVRRSDPSPAGCSTREAEEERVRRVCEKRLQHEKYREELRQQIEEKKRLEEQERRRTLEEEGRLELRIARQRAGLRREYEAEVAKLRLKSRSQPDLRQVSTSGPRGTPPRLQTRSPSYVCVRNKGVTSRSQEESMRLRFEDKKPSGVAISTQTGDSLMEDVAVKTPKPEPHPRVSKLLKNSQMRILPVKQKLKENQEKMLLRLASVKQKQK